MKLAYCCLLLGLAESAALARTPSPKKPGRRHAVAQKQNSKPTTVYYPDTPTEQEHCQLSITPAPTGNFDPNLVYTCAEHMPTLPGQRDRSGISAAIQRQLVLPQAVPPGRVFVQFVVTKEGVVVQPQVIKGLRADVDSAVVVATRKLPRFTPGQQQGQAVAVSLVLAVMVP
ncbi:energy transducer TonB [Hymenobacter sp. H14-R3]|uniref:energy transducer TonB n=1 Tax=Hymenobacter sp. H14-R3 TaxID=3046308 RepID=UPI0024B8CFE8|nr:energy transducer TonB [Hymenobacter sp. H14-R3]MDJ0364108.1 energy transducer TonB [Hymenobacter sp. H14-R3]